MSWNNLRTDQLKQILSAVGLPITGGKNALLERLSSQSIQQHVDRVVALSLRGALTAVVRAKNLSPPSGKSHNGTLKDRILGYAKDHDRGENSSIPRFDEKDEDEDDEDENVNTVSITRNRAQDLARVPKLPPMMGEEKRLSNTCQSVSGTQIISSKFGSAGSKKRPRVDTVEEGENSGVKRVTTKRTLLSTPPPTSQNTKGTLVEQTRNSPASVVPPEKVEEQRNRNTPSSSNSPVSSLDHECMDITSEYLAQEHAKRMSYIRHEYSRYTGKEDDAAVKVTPKHWEKHGYVILQVSPPGSQEPIFIRVTHESSNAQLMSLCACLLGLSISNLEFWAYGGFGKDSVGIKMRNQDFVRNFVSSKCGNVVKVFIRKRHSKGKIRIFVKTPADKLLTYCIGESERIETVKMRIQLEESISPEQQVILFNGKKLEPGRTLNDYNITNESTIHVMEHKEEESISKMSPY